LVQQRQPLYPLESVIMYSKFSFITDEGVADEMSGLTQLERVCAEILQTENVYVEDLRQVVEVSPFYYPSFKIVSASKT
jgi:hypothetical protein